MAALDEELRTSLYVGDLHPDVAEKDLIETFSRFGPLLSVHLCRDKFSLTCNSLCYGYVNFWLPCHALNALKCLNRSPLKGKPIRIMWYERDPIARKNDANLFVKNLDKSITHGRLQDIFCKYGTILSCKVAEENGISKGFGFVQFDSENSAVAARSSLHDVILEGKKLYVSKLIRKDEGIGAELGFRSLFVKHIDRDITADALKAKFSEYGQVSNAVIMKDEKGKPKGFGFVNFDSHEAAKRAMHSLNGQPLGSKNIVVARALKKSDLRKNSRQMPKHGHAAVGCKKMASDMFVKNRSEFAKPTWNDGVSNACFPSPYNRTAPNVAAAKPKGKEAIKLQKPFVKSHPLPFYASNPQQPQFSYPYFGSSIPLKQPIPFRPTVCQYFAGLSNSSYPSITQNIQGNFNAVKKPSSQVKLGTNGHVQELSRRPHARKLFG